MCTVSFVGDTFTDRWRPYTTPQVWPTPTVTLPPDITREEFDALKKEVELMKTLLLKAKAYDEEHGEPDCEMDEKVEVLKRMAELMGVDLSEVFG